VSEPTKKQTPVELRKRLDAQRTSLRRHINKLRQLRLDLLASGHAEAAYPVSQVMLNLEMQCAKLYETAMQIKEVKP